jgi:ketosteroid isomerase-like protein
MSQESAARPPLVQNENIKAEIRRSLTQSASAFNRCDLDTSLGAYAPDAVVLPPNSPAVQGIHAIRQEMAPWLLLPQSPSQ